MAESWADRNGSFADRHGFLDWLDATVEDVEPGRAVMTIPAREEFRNPIDADPAPIHGGIVSSLIDTVSGVVLRTTFDDPTEAGLTTTSLDVSYLRPATGDLRATAEVVRAGNSMGVTDVTVTSTTPEGEEKKVAVGRTNYRLFRPEGR